MSSALVFRSDISGLRAVAVLSVVFFHCGISFLPGGFAGVDVFFVISGFLITSIILRDIDAERFSFVAFYERRVKRLLPAALVVTLSSLAIAYLLLVPEQYENLAKSAIYTTFFAANFFFYNNSGYFDQAAEESPLLHMWSLGVEEQFYFVFPLVFSLFLIFFKRPIAFKLLALVFIVSFSACIYFGTKDSHFTFYMLPTRAWELGVGSLLAISSRNRSDFRLGPHLSLLGLLLILLSFLFLSEELVYPGYWAVIPVVGTALILCFGSSSGVVGRLLSLASMQFIGKISYSAYLWHWPIIVFYRAYVSGRSFSVTEVVLLVIISFLFGWLSWRFVEERFRYLNVRTPVVIAAVVFSSGIVVASSAAIVFSKGFEGRVSDFSTEITDIKAMWEWSCIETKIVPGGGPSCVIGVPWDKASKKGVVWGDSHSEHFAAVLHSVAQDRGISLVVGPRSCPPYLNGDDVNYIRSDRPRFTEICTYKQRSMIQWINNSEDIDVVIMAAAWSGYGNLLAYPSTGVVVSPDESVELMSRAFKSLFEKLDLSDRELLLIGEVPRLERSYNECVAALNSMLLREQCAVDVSTLNYKDIRTRHHPYNSLLSSFSDMQQASITVLLPSELMCSPDSCTTYVNNEFIYRDSNHIRRNLSSDTNARIASIIGLDRYFDELVKKN